MGKERELMEMVRSLGGAKAGFCQLGDLLPPELGKLTSGISILVRLSDQIVSGIDLVKGPSHTYFHHYRTANALIDQIGFRLANKLQDWGYLAMAIPASQSINKDGWNYRGLFQHRITATRSGMGWIGKNSCLITEEFGPRVRLGTVLTNMEFNYNKPIQESRCGECSICVDLCPAEALKGGLWEVGTKRDKIIDPEKCSQHMKKEYKYISRGAVCGICVRACPQGREILKR